MLWRTIQCRQPPAFAGQSGDAVVYRAAQIAIGIVELNCYIRCIGRIQVLDVERRVIGAAEGIPEEHGDIGIGTATHKTIVRHYLRTDMRTTDGHDVVVRLDLDAADPGGSQRSDGGQPVAFGRQG